MSSLLMTKNWAKLNLSKCRDKKFWKRKSKTSGGWISFKRTSKEELFAFSLRLSSFAKWLQTRNVKRQKMNGESSTNLKHGSGKFIGLKKLSFKKSTTRYYANWLSPRRGSTCWKSICWQRGSMRIAEGSSWLKSDSWNWTTLYT